MLPHQKAVALAAMAPQDLNEADTRHQIIDVLLHEVMSWPRERVECEPTVHSGFIDYKLTDPDGVVVLVIEAKKQNIIFKLPNRIKSRPSTLQRAVLSKLMTDGPIRDAVTQVVTYATSIGSRFAAITNGCVFIVFQSFVPGKDFRDAEALVIPTLGFFSKAFIEAENLLSFISVTKRYSLFNALSESHILTRDFFYPKEGVEHYDAPLGKNQYARFLDPLSKKFFSDIAIDDKQLMDKCYVYACGSDLAETGIKEEVLDLISPYLVADGGKQIDSRRTGGLLTHRIAAALAEKKSEVLILFGGKGAGKSTFLRRLFYYDPPTEFRLHLFPIVLDFLQAAQKEDSITEFIWRKIIESLDLDKILEGDLDQLAQLFEDKMRVALKQDLFAYVENSQDYRIKRAELIVQWKSDVRYVAKSLLKYWNNRGKGIAIAFDNTDQMPPALQDHCFLQAQNVAAELGCIALISMREERYCRARTMGVLDAYYNSGYHLSSPDLILVFEKRLKFALSELHDENSQASQLVAEKEIRLKLIDFFKICLRQFRDPHNALTRFVRECSRTNTRLALEFFRQFLTSGYTNVDEMIEWKGWVVSGHQVIKPMMIPERFNYDESKSIVPNLFQCRNARFGSHFTALRILAKLRFGLMSVSDKGGYKRVDALCDEFESKFRMKGDFISSIDILLRHGMVEANNRIDSYSVVGKDGAYIYADEIRVTPFGVYAADFLIGSFAYLDLVSMDCGLAAESLYSEFCASGRAERVYAVNRQRKDQLYARISRVEKFISYLETDELREAEEFQIDSSALFMPKIAAQAFADIKRVKKSAARNLVDDADAGGAQTSIREIWEFVVE